LHGDVLLGLVDGPDVVERLEEHRCQVECEVEVPARAEFLYDQQLMVGDSRGELVRCFEFPHRDLQGVKRSDPLMCVVKIKVEVPGELDG
jgi:hypothetical protein